MPLIEKDFLSIVMFGDIGGMLPYANNTFMTDVLYYSGAANPLDAFRNYGIAAGLFGNIFVVDYRLEYLNYNGASGRLSSAPPTTG